MAPSVTKPSLMMSALNDTPSLQEKKMSPQGDAPHPPTMSRARYSTMRAVSSPTDRIHPGGSAKPNCAQWAISPPSPRWWDTHRARVVQVTHTLCPLLRTSSPRCGGQDRHAPVQRVSQAPSHKRRPMRGRGRARRRLVGICARVREWGGWR